MDVACGAVARFFDVDLWGFDFDLRLDVVPDDYCLEVYNAPNGGCPGVVPDGCC